MSPEVSREDDLDPLAPVIYGDTPEDENPEADIDAADGGVSDSDNIVRVWLEDARLTKVRVSPTWFTRLGKRSLSDCFEQALGMANAIASVTAEPTPGQERELPRLADADLARLPQFNSRTFAVMQHLVADAEERWDQAIARHRDLPPAEPVTVEGRSKGVTVVLDEAGLVASVRFDKAWLDSVQAPTICEHVLLAAENGYAKYVPPTGQREELDDLEDEHRFLMSIFKAMLNPKER